MAQAQVPRLPTVQEFKSFNLTAFELCFEDNDKATIPWCRQHWLRATEQDCNVCQTMRELKIYREHKIVDWNQFCREMAVQHFVNHPKRLGGNGHIVEIDESLFARQKYERGNLVREQWILGWVQGRDKQRVPGTGSCKGPSYIFADHPAMGGTQHNDMDGYVGSISGHNLGLLTAQLTTPRISPPTLNRGNNEQSGGNVAEGQSKVQGNVVSNKPRNGGKLPFYLSEFMWS
eukprot:gene5801-11098_t